MTAQRICTDEHQKHYPAEYLRGIELFNAGEYFRCHEVLESIWLVSCGREKLFYQGLIMAAVALYHYELGRFGAARTMYRKAKARLERLPERFMSLDVRAFIGELDAFFDFTIEEARAGGHHPEKRPTLIFEDDVTKGQ